MEVSKIDICVKTDELRKFILQHPELPIIVLTHGDVIADDSCWWIGCDVSYRVEKLLCIDKYGYNKIIDDESDLEEFLENELADMEEYKDLSDSEFNDLVKVKLKEYESLWTECIVIRSSI